MSVTVVRTPTSVLSSKQSVLVSPIYIYIYIYICASVQSDFVPAIPVTVPVTVAICPTDCCCQINYMFSSVTDATMTTVMSATGGVLFLIMLLASAVFTHRYQ